MVILDCGFSITLTMLWKSDPLINHAHYCICWAGMGIMKPGVIPITAKVHVHKESPKSAAQIDPSIPDFHAEALNFLD